MAPRTVAYFALLLATTAIATPLARGVPDAPAMAIRDALPASDGSAGAIKRTTSDKREETTPDVVFIYDKREEAGLNKREEATPDLYFLYDDSRK
ncbi:hypothetical protein PG984_002929 [Apiospora sp. TS-2023a]